MEVDNLSPNTYNSDNDNIKVNFALRLVMLYCRVCNILSFLFCGIFINTSPKCCTDGESLKKMNSVEIIQKPRKRVCRFFRC